MNKQTLLKGFYLDVSRYSFNYLSDNHLDSLIIKLDSEKERTIFKSLMKNSFNTDSELENKAVMLYIDVKGTCLKYIDSNEGMSLKEFIDILYRYADREDSSISKLTQKRLFKESLDFGLNSIGYSK